ncbi:MAG: response regulator transcription factor [Acidobacteriota bacterium]|jgi:two-component system, OmpR family, alkaline phosphatase synthesis response regulator PhoP
MAKESILLVDDEEDILALLRYNLEKEGYGVEAVTTGEDGLQACRSRPPGLVILDLMLPGLDGLEVCRLLKKDSVTASIPIIMLTAKGEEADVVTGLEMGADDYVTKPFSPRVLLARVRSVLRRRAQPEASEEAVVNRGGISIHTARREVKVEETPVELTATEFGILLMLARRPGWVFTRNQIIESVRGDNYPVTDRSVDVHMTGLRKKLGAAGDLIETVRGVGYRFRE